MEIEINQSKSTQSIEHLSNIHPRLCTLHKWPHFDGYGIHLSCNKDWRGLFIEDIEINSPAENAGLLRNDIILRVNGRSIENEDFFSIISFIQHELQQDQIEFLVLDPYSAELALHYQLNIDEDNHNCVRTETSKYNQNSNHILKYIQNTDEKISPNSFHENIDLEKCEPRLCTIILPPGVGSIGLSLQSDADFSHIITNVQRNSLADRAGIEVDDCIISFNNILLLQISFEDVLYHLAKIRNYAKLDLVVAKKSYLLKLSKSQLASNTNEQTCLSSDSTAARNRSLTLPDFQIVEPIDQVQEQMIMDEQYDRLSLQIYSNLNVTKRKKRHGKILDGIGPATASRYSWSIASERTGDYSSVHSELYARRTS